MKRIIKFFSSIKLAIILLICLAFTSIIGTLIAQKQNPVLYIQHYGEGLYKFFNLMGFFNVYHSWWFIALLAFLSVNILFCSLRRLPRDIKRMKTSTLMINDEEAKKYHLFRQKSYGGSCEKCKDLILTQLKRNGFGNPIQEQGEKEESILLSEKGRKSPVFFYMTHLSIIIILIGGILSALIGIKGYLQINEGESADKFYEYPSNKLRDFGFILRCDSFDIEYYPDNMRPKDYRSKLTILDNDREAVSKVIEVNKPLRYKGITIYQSSYGEETAGGEILLNVKSLDPQSTEDVYRFRVKQGEVFDFTGADGIKRQVKVVRFLPDFVMDQSGKPISKSDQLKNPAVQLLVTEEGQAPFAVWSFQMYPDFQMVKKGNYIYNLKGYQGRMYTGLQVGKDPGIWVVWLGCILLMIGVTLVLFTAHQRVLIKVIPGPQGCVIHAIGLTDKNKVGFENRYKEFWQQVENSLGN